MRSFMRNHQIDALFHFTRASNLPNIFRYGLLPRKAILEENIDSAFNDQYRYDNCENALCLSIGFPNYKMFYSLRMKDEEVNWAVIKLDASILLNFDCAFCISNAGSEEVYSTSLEKRKGCRAFEKLYEDYPGQPSRSEMGTKNWYPTNPQAEVLVFGCVPLTYIKEVHFENETALVKYRSCIPSQICARICNKYFFPREDHCYWGKGD